MKNRTKTDVRTPKTELEETNMKLSAKISSKVMKAATQAAEKVAVTNVNSACTYLLHQPKVPAMPKRLEK